MNSKKLISKVIIIALLLCNINIYTFAAVPTISGFYTESFDQGIKVGWTYVYNDPTSYTIKRAETRDGTYNVIADNVTERFYEDTGLENGKAYYYKVIPKNADGIGNESEIIEGTPSKSNYLWVDVYGHKANLIGLEVYDTNDNKIFYEASYIADPTMSINNDSWADRLLNHQGWSFNYGSWSHDYAPMTRMRIKLKPHIGVKKVSIYSGASSPIKTDIYETVDGNLNDTAPFAELYFQIIGKSTQYEIFKSGLKASGQDKKVYIQWNQNEELNKYTIKRSENENGPFTVIASNLNSTEYIDNDVENQKTYYYKVGGLDQGGNTIDLGTVYAITTKVRFVIMDLFESYDKNGIDINELEIFDVNNNKISYGFTESAKFDTPIDYDPGNAIEGIGSEWELFKNAQDGNYTSDYNCYTHLYDYLGDGEWARYALRLDENTGISKINLWASNNGQPKKVTFFTTLSYDYNDNLKLRRNDNIAFYAEQNIADAEEVIKYEFTQSPPDTPQGLNAISEDARAKIKWDKVDNADSYILKRSVSSGGPYTVIKEDILDTQYTDNGLVNGTEYYYVVSAVNEGGESSNSLEAAVIPSVKLPQAPIGLIAKSGNNTIELNWQPIYNADTYTIKRSATAGGPYEIIQDNIAATTFTDNGLLFGTSYYYVVSANNTLGESNNSQEVQGTPGQLVPEAPQNIITKVKDQRVYITWDTANRAISYKVSRSNSEDGIYNTIEENIKGISYEDISVEADKTYFYKITAVNEEGESVASNPVQITIKNNTEQPILLSLTMKNGTVKDYILTQSQLTQFMNWYQEKTGGKGLPYFTIMGKNKYGAYKSNKIYILFDSILSMDIKEIQE